MAKENAQNMPSHLLQIYATFLLVAELFSLQILQTAKESIHGSYSNIQ